MRDILIVGVGGFLGSTLRFKIGGWILHHCESWRFPLSTFCVNVIGCFIIGLLAGASERHHLFDNQARLFLITGLLGGFTTFSAFGLETFYLIRTNAWQLAAINTVCSVACCILAVFLGERLATVF